MFSRYDDIMSPEDAMEALNIGRSKLYELLRSGQIKSWKMKKGYRIPKIALKDFVINQAKLNMERYRELEE
ncbi:helix-turn-helix domain-containing protein [Paenibacillus glucanolyticus]|uniref:helix-turn-helix domain-containing protein n=2 Tax=Paenibacillus glucanolyticus TaxID=59843 RepID=UPI0036CD7D30